MLHFIDGYHDYLHPHGLHIYRPEGMPVYVFVYFKSPAEVLTDGGWVPARQHCVLFEPLAPQEYRSPRNERFYNDWFHFTCDEPGFINGLKLPLNVPIPCYDALWVGRCVTNLQTLAGSTQNDALGRWNAEIADAEMRSVLYRLSAIHGAQMPPAYARYISQLSRLRGELYSQPRSSVQISALADSIGLSSSHFQSLYKQYFGVAVGDDIINSRLERARFLLLHSDYAVGQISQMSGYDCQAHFIRQFKKRTGVTPGQYRKQQ